MRKSWAVIVLLTVLGIALPAKAQEDAAKLEAYAGYDYIRFNINAHVSGLQPSESFNANGGGGQLVCNANNWLGVVGDLSGYGVTDTSSHLVGWVMPIFSARESISTAAGSRPSPRLFSEPSWRLIESETWDPRTISRWPPEEGWISACLGISRCVRCRPSTS
jgi:hypothetical protein